MQKLSSKPKIPSPLIPLTDIEEKEMLWLWYPYIPQRDATMIFGPGGIGKSHIAVDIAARVSTGEPFPFTDGARRPSEKVLILSAEDDASYVLKPRLRKAGANMSNIYVPSDFFTVDKRGLALIDYYIEDVTLGMVFIDPVVAYVGTDVDINRANEVRAFVGGLQNIAKDHGIPIVYVHHSRKSNDGRENDKAMGSADFVNGSRSTLSVAKAPDGTKIMIHSKTNYASEGPTLAFSFGDHGFEWTGVYDDRGISSPRAKRKNSAGDWIKQRLANGPVLAAVIEQEAEKLDINRRTLFRAKIGLAESYLTSVNGKRQWYWKLKEAADDKADVPVMDGKWGPEKQSRIEREIHAREIGRSEQIDEGMGKGRRQKPQMDKHNPNIDDLMDKVLG